LAQVIFDPRAGRAGFIVAGPITGRIL